MVSIGSIVCLVHTKALSFDLNIALYQTEYSNAHPQFFLHNGQWEQ